jgi:hypothetical protein
MTALSVELDTRLWLSVNVLLGGSGMLLGGSGI